LVFRHFFPCVQDNAGIITYNMHGSSESLVIIGSPLRTMPLTPIYDWADHTHTLLRFSRLYTLTTVVMKGQAVWGFTVCQLAAAGYLPVCTA